eukprot:5687953-Amphidinium_carterae.1
MRERKWSTLLYTFAASTQGRNTSQISEDEEKVIQRKLAMTRLFLEYSTSSVWGCRNMKTEEEEEEEEEKEEVTKLATQQNCASFGSIEMQRKHAPNCPKYKSRLVRQKISYLIRHARF